MPWPRNTITYTLPGGTTVTSTMNYFQHGERVGWALAVVLPVANDVRFTKPSVAVNVSLRSSE